MKKFELPEMEISMFSNEDIITASAGGETPVTNTLSSEMSGVAGNDILSDTISTFSIGFDQIDMGA